MDFHNSVLMVFSFLAGGKRKISFSVSGNDVCKWKPQPEMNEILKPISNRKPQFEKQKNKKERYNRLMEEIYTEALRFYQTEENPPD